MDWLTQPLLWIAIVLIGLVLEWGELRRLRKRIKNLEFQGTWRRLRDSVEQAESADSKNLSEADLERLLELEATEKK